MTAQKAWRAFSVTAEHLVLTRQLIDATYQPSLQNPHNLQAP